MAKGKRHRHCCFLALQLACGINDDVLVACRQGLEKGRIAFLETVDILGVRDTIPEEQHYLQGVTNPSAKFSAEKIFVS